MANRYIRHGEAFCGDGTTSAAATSNGGVGAWNNINVFEGTTPAYGSLAAGDVVYIRSKDQAGANITRTLAANTFLGSTAGTAANPIAWIIDGGTIWPGINGVITYSNGAGTSYYVAIRVNNIIECETQDSLVLTSAATYFNGTSQINLFGTLKRARIESADVSTPYFVLCLGDPNDASVTGIGDSLTIKIARANLRIGTYAVGRGVLIAPDIEISSTTTGQILFYPNGSYGGADITVIGGRIYGAGATSNCSLVQFSESINSGGACKLKLIGTDIPRAMPTGINTPLNHGSLEMVGVDGGIGSHIEEKWGWATSRTDNNPPYLNAALPNSAATPWAWRVYPKNVSFTRPAKLSSAKMFTAGAAIKTITSEFLVANTMSPTKRQIWITVEYIDNATGLPKHLNTQVLAGGALDSSSASWAFTTWGMVSFNKRKCEITTPTSIKQDTMVTVTWWCACLSASDQDILFLDHDFSIA